MAGLLVSAIAAFLVNRALRPLIGASAAVRKLGQGRLDTRIPVKGKDELAVLGSNINQMAGQLQTLIREQENLAERAAIIYRCYPPHSTFSKLRRYPQNFS
jgi:methyl-accepting chemotaxis protein